MSEPAVPPKPRSALKRFLRIAGVGLLSTVVLLLASIAAIWVASKLGVSVARFDAAIRALRPVFMAIQLTLIALLWWYWNSIVTWLVVRKYGPDKVPHPVAFEARHRVTLALLIAFLMATQVTA